MKHSMKRKGFTLVELLIVIVVIGILSAMMMMSSTEAVTSAKASNAVSNLRNLKTAALAMYTDSMDNFVAGKNPTKKEMFSYLNSGTAIADSGDYDIVSKDGGSWFISYKINGTKAEKERIQSKLKGRAKSVGLLKEQTTNSVPYDGGDTVYVYVR